MPKIDQPGSLTLDMVVFIRSMGSPDCKDIKITMEDFISLQSGLPMEIWIFAIPDSLPVLRGFGGVDDL